MRKFLLIAILATASLASGIAVAQSDTIPVPVTETSSPVSLETSLAPSPTAGKGQVIFFRKGGLMGAAISCAVHENGSKLSSLPPGRFSAITVEPGVHSYSVASEATDTLRLEVEPDETYYVKCSISMGVMAGRPNLSPSDKVSFDAMSKKLKPVKKI